MLDRLKNLSDIRDAFPEMYSLSGALDSIEDPAHKLAAIGLYYLALLDLGVVRDHAEFMGVLDSMTRDADRRVVNERRALMEYVGNEIRST